jgi:hypothetical protein
LNRGFYTILLAQFLSALADNALLFAAIGLLQFFSAPEWHSPLLQTVFVIAYIVLAPLVGPFADALPKGRVMLIANTVKFSGCLVMLAGLHPLIAYAVVGVGAAMYSPAKYGILTELLPPAKLVVANSWMEGTTVAAIVLGAIIGGALINPQLAGSILQNLGFDGIVIAPKFAILAITSLYLAAAFVNLFIPRLPIDHKLPSTSPLFILHDFWHSFVLLWRDPLGQVSLAVTTLFWGVGATLRLLIIAWAALESQIRARPGHAADRCHGLWNRHRFHPGREIRPSRTRRQRFAHRHRAGVCAYRADLGGKPHPCNAAVVSGGDAGGVFRRTDERLAAASRPSVDGCRSLHRPAELQREHQHSRAKRGLCHDDASRLAHLQHHLDFRTVHQQRDDA